MIKKIALIFFILLVSGNAFSNTISLSDQKQNTINFDNALLCTSSTDNNRLMVNPFIKEPCQFASMQSNKDFARGSSRDITWLKVSLRNDTHNELYKWMSLGHSRMEKIIIWMSDHDQPIAIGTSFKMEDREIKTGVPAVKIFLLPQSEKTMIIGFQSRTFVDSSISIWNPEEFLKNQSDTVFIESIAMGGLLLGSIFSIFVFFISKEKSYIFFGIALLGSFFHELQQSGVFVATILPEYLTYYTPLISVSSGVAMVFYTAFIHSFIPSLRTQFKSISLILITITVINVSSIIYGLLVDYQTGVKVWTPGVFVLLTFGIISFVWAWRNGMKAAKFVILSFILILVLELVRLGFFYGAVQYSIIQNMLGAWATLLVTPLVLVAIAFRTQELKQEVLEKEALIKTKTKFVQLVNHEIRSPINRVINLSYNMDNKIIRDKIIDECQYALMIIDDALNNQNVHFIKANENLKVVDVKSFISRLEFNANDTIYVQYKKNKNSLLVVNHIEFIDHLLLDEYRLLQSLDNLINNAAKYCQQSEITIEFSSKIVVKNSDSNIVQLNINVIDTGHGIPQDEQEQIFQPFVRGSSSHDIDNTTGQGMGLAIVKQLVDQMNFINLNGEIGYKTTNSISLQSSAAGSCFSIILYTYSVSNSYKQEDVAIPTLSQKHQQELFQMIQDGDISGIIMWSEQLTDIEQNNNELFEHIKILAKEIKLSDLKKVALNGHL